MKHFFSRILILSFFLSASVFVLALVSGIAEAQDKQPPAGEAQSALRKDEPVDLSIDSIRLFHDLYVGLAAEIEVAVVNNTDAEARDVGVGFASDDGSSDRQIIAVGPKARERVNLKWAPKSSGKHRIVVSIVSINDTNPLNNQQAELVEVSNQTYVDLKVVSAKIPPELSVGTLANIEAEISNDADVEIREADVLLNTDDGFKDLKRVTIRPKSTEEVVFSWVPRNPGAQNISISVVCKEDADPNNNELKVPVEVMASGKPAEMKAIEEKKEDHQQDQKGK